MPFPRRFNRCSCLSAYSIVTGVKLGFISSIIFLSFVLCFSRALTGLRSFELGLGLDFMPLSTCSETRLKTTRFNRGMRWEMNVLSLQELLGMSCSHGHCSKLSD